MATEQTLVVHTPARPEQPVTFQPVTKGEFDRAILRGYFRRGNVYVSLAGAVAELRPS